MTCIIIIDVISIIIIIITIITIIAIIIMIFIFFLQGWSKDFGKNHNLLVLLAFTVNTKCPIKNAWWSVLF